MDAIKAVVDRPIGDAEQAVREALAAEGFGVLTEIDVSATLKSKLGVDRAPLKILGACNPGFAHRALEIDPSVSLLLPCNVVLEAVAGGTEVSAVDPRSLMADPRFEAVAGEAADRLRSAIEHVSAAVG